MKDFFEKILGEKGEINYLYFSFLLLFLAALSVSHLISLEEPSKGYLFFFVIYAIGQSFLEICLFLLASYMIKRWAPRWVYLLFVAASFFLMLLHFTQFIMIRLMDASLVYLFKFLFGSGIDHLIAGFQALNMNWSMIGIIGVSLFSIPVLGLGFYWGTLRLAHLKPLNASLSQLTIAAGFIGAILFGLDLISLFFFHPNLHAKYEKTLPLGTTFLAPPADCFLLSDPLPPPRDENETRSSIPEIPISHLPNIYLFIIETFRRDFLDAAPHLSAFGKENLLFKDSFSNSNSTHLSWFSIFHSDLPLYWSAMRDSWNHGSIPLQFLKKLGYRIFVYSSADLRFFGMDKLIFGSSRKLADRIEEYTLDRTLEPWERDALAIESIEKDLSSEGGIYLIFLDSTHSEYSFPKDFPLKYQPVAKEIDYLTLTSKSPELESIKNRYRTAISYIDELMGRFFHRLKEKKLYADAIIAITGDHGEEFFEEGALFHGTHLNDFQTSVPFLLKLPSETWIPKTEQATHVDLFPSILHYLTGQSRFPSLFDGTSLFSLEEAPFRMAVLQNGAHPPSEFTLEKTGLKLKARLISPFKLEILDLQGELDPRIFAPLHQGGAPSREDLCQKDGREKKKSPFPP